MHEFSTVDGFVELSECLAEMTKYVANEPSVGLFFIQQHVQNAVPNVTKLKKTVTEKSHETTFHMADLEDSVTMVRSMKECGFLIADEMIGEIKKSLVTMATKQPKIASFMGETAFYAQESSEKRSNYFSSVFNSAKQKASSLKWPQLEVKGSIDSKVEKLQMHPNVPLSVKSASTTSLPSTETDELPLSSQVEDESQHQQTEFVLVSEKYDGFKANKEGKLKQWVEGTSNVDGNCGTGDEEGL